MSLTLLLSGLGGLLLLVAGAFFFVKKSAVKQGQAQGQLQGQKEIIEVVNQANAATAEHNAQVVQQVEQVNEIHDRLNSDPDYAKRVRDRFTRPSSSDTPNT